MDKFYKSDISKAGYFHLCPELEKYIQETKTAKQLIDYRIRRKQYLIDLLEKQVPALPQKPAILAENAVLKFYSTQDQTVALIQLENCASTSCKSINALANVIYAYENDDDNDGYKPESQNDKVTKFKQSLKAAATDKLQLARALCERGYFCQSQFEEGIRSLALVQKGIALLDRGIREATTLGMSKSELTVWKYHLADLHRQMFDFQSSNQEVSVDHIPVSLYFNNMAQWYHNFSTNADDVYSIYKNRAVADIILTMEINKELMNAVPDSEISPHGQTLKKLWQGKFATVKEAIKSSPFDYYITVRAAKLYNSVEQFDEAIVYADKSLLIESTLNCEALHVKLLAHNKLAHMYTEQLNKQEEAEKHIELAYIQGKNIQKIYMSQPVAYEMAKLCLQLAVDKTSEPWYIPTDKAGYLEDAIRYVVYGINTPNGNHHAGLHKVMSDCLCLKGCFEDSIKYLSAAIRMDQNSEFIKNLLQKYCFVLFNKNMDDVIKGRMISYVAEDLEAVWDQKDATLEDILINFAKELSGGEMYIMNILEDLKLQHSPNSTKVLKGYCKLLQHNDDTKDWLKEYRLNNVTS